MKAISRIKSIPRSITLSIALFAVSACSSIGVDNVKTVVTAPAQDTSPAINHAMADFNKVFDRIILRPIAGGKNSFVPKPIRQGISNFFRNLYEPWTAINEVLQLNFKGAIHTSKRFVVNTTIGIGGLFDHATNMELDRHMEDFGQTLAVWGVKPGPYIVLPILGPSNLRDAFGFGVDIVLDPVNFIALKKGKELIVAGRVAMNAVEFRAANHALISLYMDREDSYQRLKLFYEQTRAFQIRNGLRAPDAKDEMFLDDEPECYPADEALEGDRICEEPNL